MNPLYNNEVITTTPFIVDNTIQATRFNKGKSLVSFIYEQKISHIHVNTYASVKRHIRELNAAQEDASSL